MVLRFELCVLRLNSFYQPFGSFRSPPKEDFFLQGRIFFQGRISFHPGVEIFFHPGGRVSVLDDLEFGDVNAGEFFYKAEDKPDADQKNKADNGKSKSFPGFLAGFRIAAGS